MKKPLCLIMGGKGQLAQALRYHPLANLFHVMNVSRVDVDICDTHALQKCFSTYQPDIVINTAAYTAVDHAESEPELAYQVNVHGCRQLATLCARHHIPLIHFSTDYVFNGHHHTPYTETDRVSPLGIYGKTKLQGEAAIREIHESHLIFRISGVFSAWGHNFVKSILSAAKQREQLDIVIDQITCPTSATDIAGMVWRVLITGISPKAWQDFPWGTYHYCSYPETTWYHFAEHLYHYAKTLILLKTTTLNAVDTRTLNRPAPRPRYASFNCDKLEHTFGIKQPAWQHSLRLVLNQLTGNV